MHAFYEAMILKICRKHVNVMTLCDIIVNYTVKY